MFTITKFRNVPWEEIESCFTEDGKVGGKKFWEERLRGKEVRLEVGSFRTDNPRSDHYICPGPWWLTNFAEPGNPRGVCAHMIEVD